MRFENRVTSSSGESYEKPKPGKYIGVLVGFAYVGTQPSNLYKPSPRVLLRWELHKRKGPSQDSKGFIHTVTATYGATVTGQNSNLRKVIEAHSGIGVIEQGEQTDSAEWLGRAAWLDLKGSEDLDQNGEPKYINVAGVSPLDPEDDQVPEKVLSLEHWDDDSAIAGIDPPAWAEFWISRSLDMRDILSSASRRSSEHTTKVTSITKNSGGEDDDIPF